MMLITAVLFRISLLFPHCANMKEAAMTPTIAATMMISGLQRTFIVLLSETTVD